MDGHSGDPDPQRPPWTYLVLDLDGCDDAGHASYVERGRAQGLRFATLAELGDTEENRMMLYELNKTCSADIPDRGEFYTLAEYVDQRIQTPTFRAEGVAIALDEDDRWVGFTATSIRDGFAFSEMTGVLRERRGRGLSLALKVLAIDFARRAGETRLRTYHHPDNAAPIAMNRRLGFVDDPDQTPP